MRNRENDLARAEVRAVLGFECKRAVAQEAARAKQHGSSSTAGLVCQAAHPGGSEPVPTSRVPIERS